MRPSLGSLQDMQPNTMVEMHGRKYGGKGYQRPIIRNTGVSLLPPIIAHLIKVFAEELSAQCHREYQDKLK